jgi:hypothetical protein
VEGRGNKVNDVDDRTRRVIAAYARVARNLAVAGAVRGGGRARTVAAWMGDRLRRLLRALAW